MTEQLGDLAVFVAVARAGGFREAARLQSVSASSLSAAVRRLETRLGVRLLHRSTRSVVPTEAGARLLDRLGPALGEVEAALDVVNGFRDKPAGTLRLNVPASASRLVLPAIVPPFLAAYPEILLEVVVEESFVDVLAAGCDAGIRYEERLEQDVIAIPIGPRRQRMATAASPAYLAQRGQPKTVSDLQHHDLLIYSHANHPNSMEFTKGDERESVKIQPVMETNDGQIVRAAALAGAGILVQPKYIIYDDLVSGRLLPVLDDWDLPRLTINLAFQDRRYMPAKTRLFIDFLLEHFKREGYERYWTR